MRAIIIHGWGDVPYHGWYPWIRKELEKRGFEVLIPRINFKTANNMKDIISHLAKIIGKPGEETFLVGHSAGCITILKYLETLKAGEKIGGAVFVAGFIDIIDHEHVDKFFGKKIDWNEIKKHCSKFVAINSDNDKYVSLEQGKLFREKLGAELIIEHQMGHINEEFGIFELPSALKSVLKISGKDN